MIIFTLLLTSHSQIKTYYEFITFVEYGTYVTIEEKLSKGKKFAFRGGLADSQTVIVGFNIRSVRSYNMFLEIEDDF